MKFILIIPEAETYLNPTQKQILALLSELNERYAPLILILSLFEANFTHPDYLKFMPASTRLYENIFSYPLYDKTDTIAFIEMLEKLWDLIISDKTRESIIHAGGGHFWLVKQAVREVSSFADWKVDSAGMMFRLRTIYNFMLPSEQSVIRKLVTGNVNFDENERLSLNYLKKMNFVGDRNNCLIGGFSDLLLQPHVHSEEIVLRDNQIYINEVPVNKLFSRKEMRVFRILLEHKNLLVSREDIARCLWPKDTENHYSDWAIDQQIARLRKRLQELSLSPKLLEVVRGRGYRFKLPQLPE